MSDNFLITQGSGTTIATHQNGDGSHEQKVQVTVIPTTTVTGTVSVGNFPATQPISGSITVSNFPGTQPVSGTVAVSNFPADQFVSIDRTGRTLVMKTGTLVTTAVTADQVVLTYTVTVGKTLYLEYITWDARLTAVSATASILGTISLEAPSGTKVFTSSEVNPTTSETGMAVLTLSDPLPIPASTVIRWVTTPAATTSMTWVANFGGFEA